MEKSLKFTTHLARMVSPVRFRCEAGSRIAKTYEPVYDRRGVWHLEESGHTNKYLEIQSFADSCDINIIMARYRNGEVDVLQQIQGTYGDFSEIPTNYADIMNKKIQAENLFMSLSADIREKYNNSVEQFMSEIGSKSGLEKLGVKFSDSDEKIVESMMAATPIVTESEE